MFASGYTVRRWHQKDEKTCMGAAGYIHYFDCYNDFTGAYIGQNVSNRILYTWAVLIPQQNDKNE